MYKEVEKIDVRGRYREVRDKVVAVARLVQLTTTLADVISLLPPLPRQIKTDVYRSLPRPPRVSMANEGEAEGENSTYQDGLVIGQGGNVGGGNHCRGQNDMRSREIETASRNDGLGLRAIVPLMPTLGLR